MERGLEGQRQLRAETTFDLIKEGDEAGADTASGSASLAKVEHEAWIAGEFPTETGGRDGGPIKVVFYARKKVHYSRDS